MIIFQFSIKEIYIQKICITKNKFIYRFILLNIDLFNYLN